MCRGTERSDWLIPEPELVTGDVFIVKPLITAPGVIPSILGLTLLQDSQTPTTHQQFGGGGQRLPLICATSPPPLPSPPYPPPTSISVMPLGVLGGGVGD
ncbi:hypothetical protein FKM82_017947 [Ascaphus truei]